jgi:N-acetylmuramoyl-L-alanine amidase
MANILVAQFHDRLPAAPHAIERAPLRVLETANMPAVLIELGYLTNAIQEKQLAGGDFQTVAAQAIVEAITRFREALTAQNAGAP